MPAIRFLAAALLAALAVCSLGCNPVVETPTTPDLSEALAAPEDFQQELDDVLSATRARRLSLDEHAAWQILHGALAFGTDFQVERDGQWVSAVEHLTSGGRMRGWTTEPGIDLGDGRRGLRAMLEAGSKSGQGHADQWFAVLAQTGLPPESTIIVDDQTYTMADFVHQVQWDVPRNVEQEYSWTLIGLTIYLQTDATWTAADDQQWSIERLMEIELEHDLYHSACGGTHRLIGLTMALNRHLADGGQLEGVWQRADDVIQQAIQDARTYQNPDGSFSTHYLERPGSSPDLAQNLGATGHVLEFLTLAMTDDQLREDWVQRGAAHLCQLFRDTKDLPLECGALYHAAHGLVMYQERLGE